jgi:DNA topoisomerase-1
VLRDREYVKMEKQRFVPEDKGRLVTAFLEQFFKRYVEYDFTAALEEQLDLVSDGKLDWKQFLRDFWKDFHAAVGEIAELRTTNVLDALNEALGPHIFPDKGDGSDPRLCPTCHSGQLSLKTGKFGAFIGCSNYPECRYTRQLGVSEGDGEAENADKELGANPETGRAVWLKNGRFGPYVEELAAQDSGDKPKRSSLPKGWIASAMDLEKALRLLSLPREVGKHPDDGKVITAGLGRFGPFVPTSGPAADVHSGPRRRPWPNWATTPRTASPCACCRGALVPTSSTATPTPTCPRARIRRP